ncbi:DUF551 domain-containing protein [Klebsiella pneumoniae]|uniref:DUF551 domain-containing protein n=1 Tax=Klebsiella pneumoniae TaxID=573 RepID=UPI001F1A43FA|nr:DUF551 domain-containing protein [Klebsiella pneumoniae]
MTSKFSIGNRELLQRISSGEAVVGIDFGNLIVRELAAFRLAAMDSEPVAEVLSNRPGNDTSTIDRALPVGTQLYRHAQQPVVPDDVLDALQKVARLRLDLNDFDGDRRGIADCLCDAEEALIEVVNCCAAMLAASPQPQNAPQNIPEIIPGWIPVSERMPEDRTQVILWDAEIGEVTSGHYSHKTHTFYHCGDAIENEITHWMAPPAAPQEMKGE